MIHTGPVRLRRRVLAALAAALVPASACSSTDGRELPPPQPGQTTTSTSAPSLESTPASGVVEVFSLQSPAFDPCGPIDAVHTCDGADSSPPLTWASVPPAAELAIVVRDLDADGFVHWVVTGMDPAVRGLGEGGLPEGAVAHLNDFGEARWRGPCPPEGETHTYEVALHALPEPLPGSDLSVPVDEVITQVEQTASEVAVVTFTYAR